MEDDIYKIIQDASYHTSSPRPIERRASLTSKLIGNAKTWIHGFSNSYPDRNDEMFARSYSSGDNFDGLSDLMMRQRSKSITGENPVKDELKDVIIPGPIL